MKVKLFRTSSETMEILMLVAIISLSNSLQITRGSNLESPNSLLDNTNNKQIYPLKALTNDSKNEEISSFQYFKNFISNLIARESIIVNSWISNTSPNTNDDWDYNLRTNFNVNKRKSLNFNNESFKIAVLEKCGLDNCSGENGRCITEKKCQCNYSFINVQGVSKKPCGYKLSYQLTAITLEILLPIGFGHFYCKRYLIGLIKFSVLFLIPLIIYVILKSSLIDDEKINNFKPLKNNGFLDFFSMKYIMKSLVSFYFLIIFFVWYVFDIVIFAANKHKDGSGFDLIPIYNY